MGGVGLDAGLHRWTRTDAETDFGLGLFADGGVRLGDHLVLQAAAQAGRTFMAQDYTGWQFGLGAGLRLDHFFPGWLAVRGLGDFGNISKNAFSLDFSGAGLAVEAGLLLHPRWAPVVRLTALFLNNDLGYLGLTLGGRFGN